jgi:hypothetical protein
MNKLILAVTVVLIACLLIAGCSSKKSSSVVPTITKLPTQQPTPLKKCDDDKIKELLKNKCSYIGLKFDRIANWGKIGDFVHAEEEARTVLKELQNLETSAKALNPCKLQKTHSYLLLGLTKYIQAAEHSIDGTIQAKNGNDQEGARLIKLATTEINYGDEHIQTATDNL